MRKTQFATVAIVLASAWAVNATLVDFDDVTLNGSFGVGGQTVKWDLMPTGYQGLIWQGPGTGASPAEWELVKMDAAWRTAYKSALTGKSGDQAAYNGGADGTWAAALSIQGAFRFDGAYFAGWPNSNPAGAGTVTVTGSLGGVQQWQITQSLIANDWTYFSGAGKGAVDQLVMSQAGGSPWLMDSLSVSTVPEASTYVAGALLLLPWGVGMFRKLRAHRTV